MKENTVYLLYNTNASGVTLHHGLGANIDREIRTRELEYEDKDEFTIMYSLDDVRKYTDIKILSKTKLKERPKSAEQLTTMPKVNVEGILMRRSNSLSIIEEDLLVLRRCPLIKPLLSETEIFQLQQLLVDCRNKQKTDKTESSASGLYQLFSGDQDLQTTTGVLKGTRHPYESTKDNQRTRSASAPESDAYKAKDKTKVLIPVTKNDNTATTKYIDKSHKTPTLISKKFKKSENKNDITSVTQNVKPKKQDFIGTRSKSEDRSKYDKRQSKAVKEEGSKKKHSKKPSETRSQTKQKTSKNKSKNSDADEQIEKKQKKLKTDSEKLHEEIDNVKKQRKAKKDSDKIQEEINKTARSKEHLSDKDQVSRSSEKTPVSKKKDSKEKSNDTIKSKDHKKNLENNKDYKRTPSTDVNENTEKPDKHKKSKSANDSDKLTKGGKRRESPIPLSSKQSLKKSKTDKVKTKTFVKADLQEDLLAKKEDGKSTEPKSSPSDKSKSKNNSKHSVTENFSKKKGKIKDKLLPGTIQYMIHYILSNPIFIDLGWTLQPTEKALSRIVTFKAVPAKPQSYCFRSRNSVEQRFYPSGALAMNIAEDGTGWINYPGGTPAIIMTRSHEDIMKLTLYSCPTNDPLVKESFYTRIIGMFDSFGNGVVYDSNGKRLLQFNQMEGIYYNPSKQTPRKWQWSCYKVLEEQRLKQLLKVMVDEEKQPVPSPKGGKVVKVPSRAGSVKSAISTEKKPVDKLYEALLEELPYPVLPKPKIKMKTHDNAFKSIVLRVNKEITLRINGQDSVAVNFSAKTLYHKMDLGVRIDPENVARVDKVADDRVGSVLTLLYPSQSPSKAASVTRS